VERTVPKYPAPVSSPVEPEFWRLPEVKSYTSRSRSAIYADPTFPRRIKIGSTACWRVAEVKAWATAQIAASRAGGDA
jgi:predicted DNA-binding transcriptional regulator AlpA